MGMKPAEPALVYPSPPSHLTVQLDGRIIGHLAAVLAPLIVQRLHSIKAAALALQEGSSSPGKLPTLQVGLEALLQMNCIDAHKTLPKAPPLATALTSDLQSLDFLCWGQIVLKSLS